jgi:hypothetical protein
LDTIERLNYDPGYLERTFHDPGTSLDVVGGIFCRTGRFTNSSSLPPHRSRRSYYHLCSSIFSSWLHVLPTHTAQTRDSLELRNLALAKALMHACAKSTISSVDAMDATSSNAAGDKRYRTHLPYRSELVLQSFIQSELV